MQTSEQIIKAATTALQQAVAQAMGKKRNSVNLQLSTPITNGMQYLRVNCRIISKRFLITDKALWLI